MMVPLRKIFPFSFVDLFHLGAEHHELKKMGDIFRRHPEYFIPDQETGFQKTASGCYAYSDVHKNCLISLVEIMNFLIMLKNY
jgi:hypothetical protein